MGLSFEISPEGEIRSPVVVESSGSVSFHAAAIRALNASKWAPAQENGKAVEGSGSIMYRFVIDDIPAEVRLSFKSNYELLASAIATGEREQATELMVSLENSSRTNNFEAALLDLMHYNFLTEFGGSDEEKMAYLSRALAYESYSVNVGGEEGFLAPELVVTARQNIFMLQVNTRRYAEAIRTYERLQNANVDVTTFANTIAKIRALQNDDTTYAVKGKTNNYGYWQLTLLKPGVYIDSPSNAIEQVRFQCQNKSQSFLYQESVEYTLPSSWGVCQLIVRGKPDAEFDLELFEG